jgi:hypothetical protein
MNSSGTWTSDPKGVFSRQLEGFHSAEVLQWLFNQDSTRAESWMVADAREVARKTLNLEQLRTLPVPIPPLAEQQESSAA